MAPTDFNQGSMDSEYSGKSYALPYFPDLGFLFFRKDIVSEEVQQRLSAATTPAILWRKTMLKAIRRMVMYSSDECEGLTVNLNEFSANWGDLSGGWSK